MYVGATPTTGDFKLLDSIITSSSTTFNLRQGGVAVYPQSANHCLVVLNGVLQTAGSSFNIVNDTIVFASSLASSDVINQILVLGNVNDIGVPSDDTVSTAKLQSSSVTDAKISAMASSKLTGVVPTANLGSGTASSSTVLYGDQTYKAEPSGTHELLLTVNASGASTVELNGTAYFKTDYHHFVVYFQNVDLSTNSSFLDVQCGISSGFITSAGYGSARYGRRTNGDGANSDLATGDYVYTQFSLNNGAAYFDGDENIQGELRIWNAFDSHYKVITSRIMYGLQDDIGILDLGGHFKNNANLTAIRFITPDSATITGTFRLYGVK